MTSFRKIVDEKLRSFPPTKLTVEALREIVHAIADEMDRRYPEPEHKPKTITGSAKDHWYLWSDL